jgi:hypothetical protein
LPARPRPVVLYDHDWRFRRDWIRDGIRWFIPPAELTEAATEKYDQRKLRYVRTRLRGTGKRAYLQAVLDQILPARGTNQEKIEAIVHFVRSATWHNPLECPYEEDQQTVVTAAHELLELHDARCWHAAEIVRQLVLQAGGKARITFLPSRESRSVQVVTEVRIDDRWRVADANYFQERVILRDPEGRLPTLGWLRDHPHYADRFPGGWIFPPEYLNNEAGIRVTGQFSLPFPEAENTWGSDHYYCYYLGAEERYPPITPPRLRVEKAGARSVAVQWAPSRSFTSELIRYDLTVCRAAGETPVAAFDELEKTEAVVGGLNAAETYTVSVPAADEHRLAEPETWYPASTLTFTFPG